jgi:hypothetical protein
MRTTIESRYTNRGIATLLTVIFVGLGLSAAVVSSTAYIRGGQSNTTTLHAQTQAQARAAMGYQALERFLVGKTKAEVDSVASGAISGDGQAINYVKSSFCPDSGSPDFPNFCFDLTAVSGGSSAVIRAIYQYSQTIIQGALDGSVFAGGLVVGGSANFTGDGSSQLKVAGGQVTDTSGAVVTLPGISVVEYVSTPFITAEELRPYSNYIFYRTGSTTVCAENNLNGSTAEVVVTCPVTGVSYDSGSSRWNVTPESLSAGVYWFEGDIFILPSTKLTNASDSLIMVNSLVATGGLEFQVPNGAKGNYNSYAPAAYFDTTPVFADRYAKACGATVAKRPTQYCDASGVLEINSPQRAMANILYFSGAQMIIDAATNVNVNIKGNIIASAAVGGTGNASGKFTGAGNINVVGNIVVSGEADVSTMQGNIDVTLAGAAGSGNIIPIPVPAITPHGYGYL